MNEFYKELMRPMFYRWIKAHKGVQVCHECCTLWIDNGDIYGEIKFHEDDIIELSVKDAKHNENLFYLHFQMNDMNSTLQQFNTFFQYLTTPFSQHQDIDIQDIDIQDMKVHKILLSCSGGLTTSYFAYSIQEIMNQKNLGIQVDAVGYTDIDSVADQYDLILLAPQIAYMLPEYKKKYGNKVMNIEAIDFATSHFEGIIEKALH